MRENEPVLLVLSVCDGKIILEKGEILYEKCHIGRGVEVGEVEAHDQGVKYATFSDPDGNTWTLQEMPWRSSEF